MNRDSAFSVVIRLRRRGIRFPAGIFLLATVSRPLLGEERPEREAVHSSTYSTEAKNILIRPYGFN